MCKKPVGRNSVLCRTCGKWIHHKCRGIKGKLKNTEFKCSVCVAGKEGGSSERQELLLGPDCTLKVVDRFCYLGDVIGAEGGAEKASRARVRCAWAKFRELVPILTSRGASLKMKGKIYNACVRSVMIYGSETWAMRVEDMHRLERQDRIMVRWMSGVTLKDRRPSEELLDHLSIESIAVVV